MTPQQRAIRDQVAAVPARIAAAARAADPEPPSPGEWPPTDIVRHLIAVEEEVWGPRLRQLMDENEPHWKWTEPDRWLGRPDATKHMFVHNEQAVLSPSWSIHCGCGTGAYRFIWAMAGENQTFDDMDKLSPTELR